MQLPGPIYESLPVIYIAAGLISVVLIEMPFSVISAALLACASWMVWRMRRRYRRNNPQRHVDLL